MTDEEKKQRFKNITRSNFTALGYVQVVHCKDCKHDCGRGHGLYCQFIECEKTGAFHKEDWFCADGEKR